MVKFLDDIGAFSKTFDPPASAELLIGAYSDIFAKFKSYEGSLAQKREFLYSGNGSVRNHPIVWSWHLDCIHLCPHSTTPLVFLSRAFFLTGAHLQSKIPELEKSLSLVKHLQSHDDSEPLITRYSLADAVFGKAGARYQ
jgi:hypothetical protein